MPALAPCTQKSFAFRRKAGTAGPTGAAPPPGVGMNVVFTRRSICSAARTTFVQYKNE